VRNGGWLVTAAEALEAEVDLTVQQVAELTSLSTDAVRRAIARGELEALMLCNRIRVEPAAFRRWKVLGRSGPSWTARRCWTAGVTAGDPFGRV